MELAVLVSVNTEILRHSQGNGDGSLLKRTVDLGNLRTPHDVLVAVCMGSAVGVFQRRLAHIEISVVGIVVIIFVVIPCDVHGVIISVVISDDVPGVGRTQCNRRIDTRGVHHGTECSRIACTDGPLQHDGRIEGLSHEIFIFHILVIVDNVFTQQIVGGILLVPG